MRFAPPERIQPNRQPQDHHIEKTAHDQAQHACNNNPDCQRQIGHA